MQAGRYSFIATIQSQGRVNGFGAIAPLFHTEIGIKDVPEGAERSKVELDIIETAVKAQMRRATTVGGYCVLFLSLNPQ
ncbi:MAG: hypothetical protein WAQ27_00460 [Candidatus Microsaccharimonas sp.]